MIVNHIISSKLKLPKIYNKLPLQAFKKTKKLLTAQNVTFVNMPFKMLH